MDAHIFKCLVFKNNAQKIDSKTSQSVHEYVFKNTRSHLFKLENMRLIKVTKNGLVHLLAEVDVNGDINDVWFLTSVLTEMTKTLPVTVRLKDSDGEFLLIQCAEFLTDEIIPENSKNRVFLVDGEIKIVNQLVLEKNDLVKKDEKFFSLSLQTGLKTVWNEPKECKVSPEIKDVIFDKFHLFEKSDQIYHFSNVRVPLSVGLILKFAPFLMPFAVKTYCSRDPKSSQYLTLLKNLGACQKLVFQNVRFTRHLFAQLFSAKLTHLSPITKSIGYGLSENREAEDDMDSTEEEIGIKLFFGFELIICEAKTWITQNFDFDVNPKFFDRLVIICPELKEFFFKQA